MHGQCHISILNSHFLKICLFFNFFSHVLKRKSMILFLHQNKTVSVLNLICDRMVIYFDIYFINLQNLVEKLGNKRKQTFFRNWIMDKVSKIHKSLTHLKKKLRNLLNFVFYAKNINYLPVFHCFHLKIGAKWINSMTSAVRNTEKKSLRKEVEDDFHWINKQNTCLNIKLHWYPKLKPKLEQKWFIYVNLTKFHTTFFFLKSLNNYIQICFLCSKKI